jgi:DNA-binding NtrC family response regulator
MGEADRRAELRVVDRAVAPEASPVLLLGDSPAMARLRLDIQSAARCDAKVLITGETGVGKEIAARLIHLQGARARQPFLAINCAGIPDSLLESELFGHVRGSFTDAYRDKPGLAVQADGGTLFLDELGEMSPRMQGVLLRFLETGEIHRLGADRIEQTVDVRVIAATNRNLRERVASGDFREDLYYRLNVAQVFIPPLRERGADILLLFAYYFERYCQAQQIAAPLVSDDVRARLLAYPWPGNVRELKNVAERIAVRLPQGTVDLDLLPIEMRAPGMGPAEGASDSRSANAPQTASRANDGESGAAGRAWTEMMAHGASFWTAVHAPFMARELTKSDVRTIVRRGLQQTQGSYRKLVELFHLKASDYKRLLAFLYQHDCHLPFHPFREEPPLRK